MMAGIPTTLAVDFLEDEDHLEGCEIGLDFRYIDEDDPTMDSGIEWIPTPEVARETAETLLGDAKVRRAANPCNPCDLSDQSDLL